MKKEEKFDRFWSLYPRKVAKVAAQRSWKRLTNKNIDSIVTGELCIEALNFSKNNLKTNGQFVSKIFMGSSFNEIISIAKTIFKETYVFKPQSSRKESKESFFVCKNLLRV